MERLSIVLRTPFSFIAKPTSLRYSVSRYRSRRSMDRTLASEAEDKGSIPFESTLFPIGELFPCSRNIA